MAVVATAQVQEITTVLRGAPVTSWSVESTDTLVPPFTDDFSYPSDKPSAALWQDAKVWVNDEMALFQNSLGVATFDGLNEYGFAYKENALGSDSLADVLTSAYLDLQGLSNVYLSFQLQEGGRGELPSNNDSIVVEYWSPVTADWTQVWGQKGSGTSGPFSSVILPVQGANYLQKVSDLDLQLMERVPVRMTFGMLIMCSLIRTEIQAIPSLPNRRLLAHIH